MTVPNILGSTLKRARKEQSLTQREVAAQAGVSIPTIRGHERLRGTVATYQHIVDALGLELRGRNLPGDDQIHQQVKSLRKRRNLSGRTLACLVGVSHPSIVSFENTGRGRLSMLNACLVILGAGAYLAPKESRKMFYRQAGTSTTSTEWHTPPELLDKLYSVYELFDLDPCSPTKNRRRAPVRARVHYTREENGLTLPWFGTVFVNPPYGRTIGDWVKKAKDESLLGCTVIGLLPARTDTKWWHTHVTQAGHIFFLKGRLRFNEANSAPFPSALVVWNGNPARMASLKERLSDSWVI